MFLSQMKRYLRKKITGSGKNGKNDVIEVNIQQEDDTDYEKQWTRRMHRAQVTKQPRVVTTEQKSVVLMAPKGEAPRWGIFSRKMDKSTGLTPLLVIGVSSCRKSLSLFCSSQLQCADHTRLFPAGIQ